jgi:hypothetical protein
MFARALRLYPSAKDNHLVMERSLNYQSSVDGYYHWGGQGKST